jgi:hypothetical protein
MGADVTHLSLRDLDALREFYRPGYPGLELERMHASVVMPLWAMLVAGRVIGTVEQTSADREVAS